MVVRVEFEIGLVWEIEYVLILKVTSSNYHVPTYGRRYPGDDRPPLVTCSNGAAGGITLH
jgi:hypothetical protein